MNELRWLHSDTTYRAHETQHLPGALYVYVYRQIDRFTYMNELRWFELTRYRRTRPSTYQVHYMCMYVDR